MPVKVIGNAHWLLQPGYPTLSGERGSERITAQFSCMQAMLGESLPAYDSTFYLEGWDAFNAMTHLVLCERNITPLEGGTVLLIDLVYSAVATTPLEGDFDINEEEPSYRGIEVEAPIERCPTYRFCWNHTLLRKDGSAETFLESLWESASWVEISYPKSKHFKIIKYNDIVPDGWGNYFTATKPGVETYKISIPEVHQRIYSRNRSSLLKYINSDLKKSTPPDDFDYPGEWLQGASALQKEGSYWVADLNWLGSKDVDDDLYS